MNDCSTLKNKEIVVFDWRNSLGVAFDLFLYEAPRLRIRNDVFWRVSKGDEILFTSVARKSDRTLLAMRDTFEGKTIKKATVRPNGDIVLLLSGQIKLELLSTEKQACPLIVLE